MKTSLLQLLDDRPLRLVTLNPQEPNSATSLSDRGGCGMGAGEGFRVLDWMFAGLTIYMVSYAILLMLGVNF